MSVGKMKSINCEGQTCEEEDEWRLAGPGVREARLGMLI